MTMKTMLSSQIPRGYLGLRSSPISWLEKIYPRMHSSIKPLYYSRYYHTRKSMQLEFNINLNCNFQNCHLVHFQNEVHYFCESVCLWDLLLDLFLISNTTYYYQLYKVQKSHNIHSYYEDLTDIPKRKMFCPEEIWSKYVNKLEVYISSLMWLNWKF